MKKQKTKEKEILNDFLIMFSPMTIIIIIELLGFINMIKDILN